jgi:hypothetical protein
MGNAVEPKYAMDTTNLYKASLWSIVVSFGLSRKCIENRRCPTNLQLEPWLALLTPFIVDESAESAIGQLMDESTDENQTENINVTSQEIMFVTIILSRCGYFLSHSNLTIRIASCKVFSFALTFLGFIADNFLKAETDDSSEHPGNAVYRQISDSWPSILPRIQDLCQEFCSSFSSNRLPLNNVKCLSDYDGSSNVLFLSALFDLLGCMVQSSGSFLWSRLEVDVWPACAQILGKILKQKVNDKAYLTSNKICENEITKLLCSLFGFYTKVFSNPELFHKAASSISTVGSMILPFVSEKDPIGGKAMSTIKTMLLIDKDALWRPLLSSSGYLSKQFSLKSHHQLDDGKLQPSTSENGSPSALQLRARELLDFVDDLPEQIIDY